MLDLILVDFCHYCFYCFFCSIMSVRYTSLACLACARPSTTFAMNSFFCSSDYVSPCMPYSHVSFSFCTELSGLIHRAIASSFLLPSILSKLLYNLIIANWKYAEHSKGKPQEGRPKASKQDQVQAQRNKCKDKEDKLGTP